MRGRANPDDQSKFIFSSRYIPEKDDAGKLYFSLSYILTKNITVGADWRPLDQKVGFLGTWRLLPETEERPAIILGTSTDDFTDGDEEITSQTVYGVVAKQLVDFRDIKISPYGGAAWIFDLDEVRPLGGINFRWEDWSLMLQYSGTDTHLTLTRSFGKHNVSFVFWGLDFPGIAYSTRF